jgi:hypothetical protein
MCAECEVQSSIPEDVRSALVEQIAELAHHSRTINCSQVYFAQICRKCWELRHAHIQGKTYKEDEEKFVTPFYCHDDQNYSKNFEHEVSLYAWARAVYKIHGGT